MWHRLEFMRDMRSKGSPRWTGSLVFHRRRFVGRVTALCLCLIPFTIQESSVRTACRVTAGPQESRMGVENKLSFDATLLCSSSCTAQSAPIRLRAVSNPFLGTPEDDPPRSIAICLGGPRYSSNRKQLQKTAAKVFKLTDSNILPAFRFLVHRRRD